MTAIAVLLAATLYWLFAAVWLTEISRGAHPFGWFLRPGRRVRYLLRLWIGTEW